MPYTGDLLISHKDGKSGFIRNTGTLYDTRELDKVFILVDRPEDWYVSNRERCTGEGF